eukprot:m.16009 g.16009  ORF g.16009 m.16009 type:complete len:338 (-) comp4557_c0_seq1:1570-2583(-)
MSEVKDTTAFEAGDEDELAFEPTIDNLVEQDSLRWVFVGGKGGVGKTTCSSSVAIQLAKSGRKVLLISTDPAHNLSDAFGQKFGPEPIKVEGVENLSCMEVDPASQLKNQLNSIEENNKEVMELFDSIGFSIPGIDEWNTFLQVMKFAKSMDQDVTVFDTAPTGHTLRLLQVPQVITAGISKIKSLNASSGGMIGKLGAMFGGDKLEKMFESLDGIKESVDDIIRQFQDPDLTTFVCVCIAEFLSIYETERLIQELTKLDIDVHNVIVNQLLVTDKAHPCEMCSARFGIQQKYLTQVDELYDDFHVIKLPLQAHEVRGVEELVEFSQLLLQDLTFEK